MKQQRLLIPEVSTVRMTEHWHVCKDGDPAGLALYERHYSCYKYSDERERKLFCGPGEKMVLLTKDCDALFVWRRFIETSETKPKGVNCAVFRNESETLLSSDLILEAERVAICRWPLERMYTYVNETKVSSGVGGYCFIRAGWKRRGTTKGGLLILDKFMPNVNRRQWWSDFNGENEIRPRP